MIQCQECQTDTIVKNGIGPEKKRHQCKSCGGDFIIADSGINPATWISGEKWHNDSQWTGHPVEVDFDRVTFKPVVTCYFIAVVKAVGTTTLISTLITRP